SNIPYGMVCLIKRREDRIYGRNSFKDLKRITYRIFCFTFFSIESGDLNAEKSYQRRLDPIRQSMGCQ
ncbi:MAG: hypothetical protein JJT78_15460, partial [Leptospira sp.]|nr:hypothetical protein [Leptospira sp.]